jgi:hypothetical protein
MMDGNIQELYDVILTQRQFSDIVGDKKWINLQKKQWQ